MIMVDIDANLIDAKPMKNRTKYDMIRAYQVLLNRITEKGVCIPKTYILENEASDEFKRVHKKVKVATGSLRHSPEKYFRKGYSYIQ